MNAMYLVLLLAVLVIPIWEIFVAVHKKPREWKTISELVWMVSGVLVTCPICGNRFKRSLVLGVAIAFWSALAGHFFA